MNQNSATTLTLPAGKFQQSAQITDLVETSAELIAENFDDDADLCSIEEAEHRTGVARSQLYGMISMQEIPSEKHGKRRYIRGAVCDTLKELRELHGRSWRDFATWQTKDQKNEIENDTETDEHEAAVESEALMATLRRRAEECRQEGRFEAAAEMFALLVDHAENCDE